jgi:uncharacterized protein (DUF2235 family)
MAQDAGMSETSPRQLILCFDGTNNSLTGGARDTNVVKLCQLLDVQANNQKLFYDPGVGNSGQIPGVDLTAQIKNKATRIAGLALGSGVYENIAQGYRFLMQHYRAGDQIFVFGFSRGAFTARSLAGMVHLFGLLRPEHDALVDSLLHFYFSKRTEQPSEDHAGFAALKAQVHHTFAQAHFGHPAHKVPIWFTGVWDTVESVGWPGLGKSITGSPTILGKSHVHVRHALALDEFRKQFMPRMYAVHTDAQRYAHVGQSIEQRWFSGSHADVGGSYRNAQSGLSRDALTWLLTEAALAPVGLRLKHGVFDPAAPEKSLHAAWAAISGQQTQPAHVIHNELQSSPIWALTGMQVRNPFHNPLQALEKRDSQHPRNEHLAPQFIVPPAATRRLAKPLSVLVPFSLILLCFGWLMLHSKLLQHGADAVFASSAHQALEAYLFGIFEGQADLVNTGRELLVHQRWTSALGASVAPFFSFQSLAGFSGRAADLAQAHPNGFAATLVDFAFVLTYMFLLARASAWAFCRLAGQRAYAPHTGWTWLLNRLGLMPMLLVLFDLAENVFTLLVLSAWVQTYLGNLHHLFALCMSVASLAKWAALLGCGLLLVWGTVRSPKP